MKYLKLIPLGIVLLSAHSYGADAANESQKTSNAISACYASQGPEICLQTLSDKEKTAYEKAYTAMITSLNDIGNSNGPLLARQAKHGKELWESSLQYDCEARGLVFDKDSPDYSEKSLDCMATQYSQRIEFYNDFGIAANQQYMDKMMKEYYKTHPKK